MDKYLIKFDEQGNRTTTYAQGIHYFEGGEEDLIDVDQCLSDGYVWVNEADYNNLLGNNAEGKIYYRATDGTYQPTPDPEPPTLDERKDAKAREVRAWATKQLQSVQSGYSQPEISSFEQQESGAKDILAGDTSTQNAQAVISLLTVRLGLVNTTPTTEQITEFANRIVNNATTARAALIQLMGSQQKMELAIRACTTESMFTAVCTQVDAVIGG